MLISFEGIDRSGKSTQAARLASALGPETLALREPGGTEAGERIRSLLKDPAVALDPLAELLCFCAARAQLCGELIRPALRAGRDVVVDRFTDSSVAYQGAARGLGTERVRRLCDEATGGITPHLTFYLRLEPAAAFARAGDGPDRFEDAGAELQHAVAAAYDRIAAAEPQRVAVLDAGRPADEVAAEVLGVVERRRERVA